MTHVDGYRIDDVTIFRRSLFSSNHDDSISKGICFPRNVLKEKGVICQSTRTVNTLVSV